MFQPKMAIIRCLKSNSYKETDVSTYIIIDINLIIVPCVCLCRWLLVPLELDFNTWW
jgi:hypothetical protein